MTLQYGPDIDLGFVDRRLSPGQTNTTPLGTPANYASESALDTRLAAAAPGTYTAAVLRAMTTNDKVYALRLLDDPTGV